MPTYFQAVDLERLPPGKSRTVEHQGHRYAVFNVDGTIHAIDDACPHRGGPLSAGFVEGNQVFCPLHGWAFDVTTGKCVSNPSRPVRTYKTKVENGHIWIKTT
jgi:NAD(P)H-dependent nitrite reductase small subunit